jgi:hypothetical protein
VSTPPVPSQVAEIARFFRRYGWAFDHLDDETFRTSFRGKNAAFVVLVRVTEHWVVFTVNPFVKTPDAGFGPVALRLLATANHHESIVKLGIDDDDDAFVNVELPVEGLNYEVFAAALTSLSHAADRLIVPLLQAVVIDDRNSA